jgi:hypothetical protein
MTNFLGFETCFEILNFILMNDNPNKELEIIIRKIIE